MNARRIIIVGPSGSGKTTLAQVVARELGLPLVSMDGFRLPGRFFVECNGERVRNYEDPRMWRGMDIACALCRLDGGFVAEGNHLLAYASIAAIKDTERYYLDVPFAVSLKRRKERRRYRLADESFELIGKSMTDLIVAPQRSMPGVRRLDGTAHTYCTGHAIIHQEFAVA